MRYFNKDKVGRAWDRFEAFYWHNKPFVLFETGELMLEPHAFHADNRGTYHDMNIRLCATENMADKVFTPDGEPVTIASLTRNGIQCFLVDYDHKMVVSVQSGYSIKDPRFVVNNNMAHAPVFYMHEKTKPQSQTLIEVGLTIPNTKEKQQWRAESIELAKTMRELRDDERPQYYQRAYEFRRGYSPKLDDYNKEPSDFINGLQFEELHFLARNGFSATYDWHEYSHLIIK